MRTKYVSPKSNKKNKIYLAATLFVAKELYELGWGKHPS